MKTRCECGNRVTVFRGQGKECCESCRKLEGIAVDSKMTESWQQRRARKAAAGLPDGDKFPLAKFPQSLF